MSTFSKKVRRKTSQAAESVKQRFLCRSIHGPGVHRYHNRYQGEECFLMGNGPSLNKVDLARLNNYHLIGLNKINLIFERQPLDLTFHVSINQLVIEQSWQDFKQLSCPSFLSSRHAKGVVPQRGNIHHIKTFQGVEARFSRVAYEPVWEGWTVTYVALQLAYFMGFKRVFLIGVDHNFKAEGKPNEEQKLTGDDPNHFDPRYFANQQWHLPDLEGSEMGYGLARFTYERSGREVVDATIGGKCQVFKKMDIEDAFNACKPKR